MAAYNEIFNEFGAKTPQYASIESRTGVRVIQPSARLIEDLGRQGVVDTAGVYPVPLVLNETEYGDVLVPGILQRAFVLQELFADIAIGSRKIVESGLLSEDELNHILCSEGIDCSTLRRLWRGHGPDEITFLYGPDLVREESGQWVVLEDNVGCVGGVGDAPVVLDRYVKAANVQTHPELQQYSSLKESISAFLNRVDLVPKCSGLCGISGTVSGNCIDFELAWKGEILKSLGIVIDQPERLLDWIVAGRIRPSAIINLSSTLAPEYLRLASNVFTEQNTPIFGGPCIGVIASKSFHALGDALTRLYLNEDSLLKTPRTQLLRNVPARLPAQGVLKRSNGCGGTEVFFLEDYLHRKEGRTLLDEIKLWGPCGAVIQEKVNRSVITPTTDFEPGAASVEIRPIVYVFGRRTAVVDKVIAGRATTTRGNRVGNISRGALHLAVLRELVRS